MFYLHHLHLQHPLNISTSSLYICIFTSACVGWVLHSDPYIYIYIYTYTIHLSLSFYSCQSGYRSIMYSSSVSIHLSIYLANLIHAHLSHYLSKHLSMVQLFPLSASALSRQTSPSLDDLLLCEAPMWWILMEAILKVFVISTSVFKIVQLCSIQNHGRGSFKRLEHHRSCQHAYKKSIWAVRLSTIKRTHWKPPTPPAAGSENGFSIRCWKFFCFAGSF